MRLFRRRNKKMYRPIKFLALNIASFTFPKPKLKLLARVTYDNKRTNKTLL